MIRDIVRDMFFLAQMSETAAAKDKKIAADLLDTLQANSE